MKVVTGSSGFVGSELVRQLLASGDEVIGIDRRPPVDPPPGLSWACFDLVEQAARVRDLLRRADTVFHLAARPGVRDQSRRAAVARWHDNVQATEVMCAAAPTDSLLVVASSSSVYGGIKSGTSSQESDLLDPRSDYARTKALVEGICERRARAGGRTLVARPFTVVGRGQRSDMALRLWVEAALTGHPLSVFGGLDRTRDFIDVSTVAALFRAAGDANITGILNFGTGQPQTLGNVIEAVARQVGRPVDLAMSQGSAEEVEHSCADVTLLTNTLGSPPATDLGAVVQQVISDAGDRRAKS